MVTVPLVARFRWLLLLLSGVLLAGLAGAQPLQRDVHTPEGQYVIAEGLYTRGFYDLAEKEFRTFLERYADHDLAPHARFRLIECLRNLREDPDTLSVINQFQAKWPDHELAPKLFLWKGELLMRQKRVEVAASCFKRLVLHEDSIVQEAAVYFLAQCHALQGNPELALETYARIAAGAFDGKHLYRPYALYSVATGHQIKAGFDEASRGYERLKDEDNVPDELREEAMYRLAENHFLARRFQPAIELYEALLIDYPDGVFVREARKRRAWSYFSLQEFSRAAELCRDWRAAYPDAFDYELDYVHGASLVGIEFFNEAADVFGRVIANDRVPPEYVRLARFQDIVCQYSMKRHEKTVARVREFTQTYPKAPEQATVQYFGGEASAALGEHEQAIELLRGALESFVGNWEYRETAYLRLTECLEKLERLKEAAAIYRRLAADETLDDRAYYQYRAGECERRAGDPHAAVESFEAVLKSFPDADQEVRAAMLHLGELYADLKQYDRAETLLRQLLARPDADGGSRLLFFLGYLCYQQEKYDEAVGHLRKALAAPESGPVSANAKFYLAGSLLELDETEESLALFAEVLLLPENERPPFPADLLLRLDRLYYTRNRYDVSEGICRWLLDHTDANVVYQASLRLVRNLSAQDRLIDAETFLNALLKRIDDPTQLDGMAGREGAREEMMSLLSEVHFLQGKYDQAVGAAEACLARSGLGVEFSSRARWVMASVLAREERLNQALHYAVACFIAADEPTYTPKAMWLTIRIFHDQKKLGDAWTTWQELRKRYPAFAEGRSEDPLVQAVRAAVQDAAVPRDAGDPAP